MTKSPKPWFTIGLATSFVPANTKERILIKRYLKDMQDQIYEKFGLVKPTGFKDYCKREKFIIERLKPMNEKFLPGWRDRS